MNTDWEKVVLTIKGMDRIELLSQRRFKDPLVAEEAVTYIIDKLSADRWKRLSGYTGNSKPLTYVYTVVTNLLEEYSRVKFGRERPPEWLKREGGTWVKVWKMLCLERQPREYIIDVCCSPMKRDPDLINSMMRTICSKIPHCGSKTQSISVDHHDSQASEAGSTSCIVEDKDTEESHSDRLELESVISLMSRLLENLDCPSNVSEGQYSMLNEEGISKTYKDLSKNLRLDEEEVLVLKMAFLEGLKLKIIANALGLPDYQPGRILRRAFKKMIKALEMSGVNADRVKALLAETEF